MFEKICIILLVNFCFYFKTLGYKYSSDDIPSSQRPKEKNKWKNAYLVLEGHLKSNPVIDHALTIFLHALVCVGIYLGFGKNNISFIAALLFSINPANNQGSVWISGRGYVLSALGMVWTLAIPFLAPLFLLICTYSNAGFLAPIALIGSNHPWVVLLLPLVWGFYWKRFSSNVKQKMDKEMFTEDKAIKPEKIVLAIKTFGFYTLLALIPFKNTFYHSFLQSASGCGKDKAYTMKDRFFWAGLVTLVLIIIYLILIPWNMISFGLIWWCISLAPFCNFMRLSQEIAERYMYVPNLGLMIVLATVLINYPVAIGVFLAMYATKLWFYMDAYQDDYYLLEYACLNSPQSWFAWHVRGMKRWDNQSYQEAIIIWTMARMISPKEFKINFNIATALKMSGHHKEANNFIKVAADNIPSGQEVESNRLITEWRSGKLAILL